jgi:uncharacterized membrane protein HdeD (DUF308 family)
MIESLTSRWWTFLVRGIAAIIFAILAFVWPGMTLLALTIVFGAYAFVDGIFALAAALSGWGGSRWWALLLEAIAGLVVAFIVWTEPTLSTVGLVYAVAIWAIITGVMEIVAGLQLREVIANEWIYVLAGIVSIAFGILVLRNPGPGIIGVAWTIGFYAIIFGLLQLGISYRLHHLRTAASSIHRTTT